CFQALEFPWTF
nr:immunoglobulin light chain junction region [Macaca mulatta]MOX98728.1 immunoglobulin light chain junction region [Macaca mulatta]